MGRSYKPKDPTKRRRQYSKESLLAAVQSYFTGESSLREAERDFGVPARTIGRKAAIKRAGMDPGLVVNGGFQPVFSREEEDQLRRYLLDASEM